ncbi:MAG: TIGR04053 family radical SAM/SPASM domain-containing protein [Chloroflexi bacterium]|nr:TIGR04053 family radical SAM/SPASM domain-containing protein [Chloroflexota bacterium]
MPDRPSAPTSAPAETAAPPIPTAKPSYFAVDFDQTPFTVAWEITRACALACIHCRAEAIPRRDPRELTTDEGFRLIDSLVEIGRPILIVTGGDPLMRRDVEELVKYAVGRGLRVGLSPSATSLVTHERLERLQALGLSMVHLSLDGSSAETHDAFRGVGGSFDRTLEILAYAQRLNLPIQVGTTVTRRNWQDLPAVAEIVERLGVRMWSVFFLVPTGRGQVSDMLDAAEHEGVLQWLHAVSQRAPFAVRTTAAQHYRRVVIQRERLARGEAADGESSAVRWDLTGAGYAFRGGQAPAEQGVNDGKGFAFISHRGEVYPSGFLQVSAGNVREHSLVEIYRESPLFRELRTPELLKGRCGACDYRRVCGGSRARAYGLTGDYLAEDETCLYDPAVGGLPEVSIPLPQPRFVREVPGGVTGRPPHTMGAGGQRPARPPMA